MTRFISYMRPSFNTGRSIGFIYYIETNTELSKMKKLEYVSNERPR